MMLDELKTPPPRDVQKASALFARNRALVRSLAIGALVCPPAVVLLFWLKFATAGAFAVAAGAGVGVLVGLFALAMLAQGRRAERLYRDGVATIGRVRNVQAPADRHGNAYVFIEVEFRDGGERACVGRVATLGRAWEEDIVPGAPVPVLYLPEDPRRFAICTSGLGMIPGVVRA